MKTDKLYSLLLLSLFVAVQGAGAQTRDSLYNYFAHYKHQGQKLKPSLLSSYDVNHDDKTISITVGGGFQEQAFTADIVDNIYNKVYSLLPDSISKYKVTVTTGGRKIDDMVPNFYRRKEADKSRIWAEEYKGVPWTKNVSGSQIGDKGFRGSHIAVWQSHGRFYRATRNTWDWQRPRLYCTTEDLFTQTFVIPYIIPMLENAGAVVYTPRDRNWQNNEVIVDNDNPSEDGLYLETVGSKGGWQQSDSAGFAHIFDTYSVTDNPFTHGTARQIETVASAKDASAITWTPYIPEAGEYAVYVSYQSQPKSISDARYQIWHKGMLTEFEVNQQIGGSTWVYLGTFQFDEGMSHANRVVLTNCSGQKGVVSADAIRFGSGMGNMLGGGKVSGLPRWAEASRYYTQWAGLTQRVYDHYQSTDDYKDDLYSRPRAVNELNGGSVFVEDSTGRGVPIELALAFHSDAGYSNSSMTGSLSICTSKRIKIHRIVVDNDTTAQPATAEPATDQSEQSTTPITTNLPTPQDTTHVPFPEALPLDSAHFLQQSTPLADSLTTYDGIDRYASHDLASMLLTGLSTDLASYNWPTRPIWDKDYCETREATVPSVILEMLSHENFFDMCLGYDPKFKFDFSRSVYKSVLRYIASTHKRDYVVQPLPVEAFCALLSADGGKAELTWKAVEDKAEPTASPQHYIVYTRIDDGDFDNGTVVRGTSCRLDIKKGHIYSYKVVAANKGGISFPSEILSVYSAPDTGGTVMLVNAFTRLEGPAQVHTESQLGFDLDQDPGVQYGRFAGFCGRQKVFSTKYIGSSGDNATGHSTGELEGHIIMGNTFDYPYIHGDAIRQYGGLSFCSASAGAVSAGVCKLASYSLVDVICGVQKEYEPSFLAKLQAYASTGRSLLITAAHTDSLHLEGLQTDTIVRQQSLTDSDSVCTYPFHHELGPLSYSVPWVSVVSAESGTPLLFYPDHTPAAVLEDKKLVCGVPFEAVASRQDRNAIMSLFLKELLP